MSDENGVKPAGGVSSVYRLSQASRSPRNVVSTGRSDVGENDDKIGDKDAIVHVEDDRHGASAELIAMRTGQGVRPTSSSGSFSLKKSFAQNNNVSRNSHPHVELSTTDIEPRTKTQHKRKRHAMASPGEVSEARRSGKFVEDLPVLEEGHPGLQAQSSEDEVPQDDGSKGYYYYPDTPEFHYGESSLPCTHTPPYRAFSFSIVVLWYFKVLSNKKPSQTAG